ncbi:MAG: diguanylate cyclase [Spirochaetaceae bacterium]
MIVLHADINRLDLNVISSLENSYDVVYNCLDTVSETVDYLNDNDVSLLIVGESLNGGTGLELIKLINETNINMVQIIYVVEDPKNPHLENYTTLGVVDCILRSKVLENSLNKFLNMITMQKSIEQSMKSLSVAVIDDSKVSLKAVESILTEEGLTNIRLFNDPMDLLANFEYFDVFFVDLIMPGITGDKLVAMIRSMSSNSIIITMSSIDNVNTISNVLSAGSDDYVVKPFNKVELLARLRTNYRSFALLKELECKNIELDRLSKTDSLTGAFNHGHIFRKVELEIENSRLTNNPVSMLLLDLDLFKNVNDKYGHGVGDNVLIALSKLFITKSRSMDCFGRYGGEEFILLMSNTSLEKAISISNSLSRTFSKTIVDGMDRPVTFSGGLVCWDGSETDKTFMKRADDLLYEAKKAARNKIMH